nr:hypothetical protein [Candidatus Sigynarchaeota archaeon]
MNVGAHLPGGWNRLRSDEHEGGVAQAVEGVPPHVEELHNVAVGHGLPVDKCFLYGKEK